MDDTEQKIAKIIDLHMSASMEDFSWRSDSLLCMAESPIEKLLGAALVYQLIHGLSGDMCFDFSDGTYVPDSVNYIIPQYQIGRFRLDFYIHVGHRTDRPALRIAVECDGHDFHERTKEQARRDRQRDRTLQSQGIMILRFTRSEIWADAMACAYQVAKIISDANFH